MIAANQLSLKIPLIELFPWIEMIVFLPTKPCPLLSYIIPLKYTRLVLILFIVRTFALLKIYILPLSVNQNLLKGETNFEERIKVVLVISLT